MLPLVDVRISEDGIASVTVDHGSYDTDAPVERDGVEPVIHQIAAKLGPVRIRVTESDESVFTDVVLPASVPAAAGGSCSTPSRSRWRGVPPG